MFYVCEEVRKSSDSAKLKIVSSSRMRLIHVGCCCPVGASVSQSDRISFWKNEFSSAKKQKPSINDRRAVQTFAAIWLGLLSLSNECKRTIFPVLAACMSLEGRQSTHIKIISKLNLFFIFDSCLYSVCCYWRSCFCVETRLGLRCVYKHFCHDAEAFRLTKPICVAQHRQSRSSISVCRLHAAGWNRRNCVNGTVLRKRMDESVCWTQRENFY